MIKISWFNSEKVLTNEDELSKAVAQISEKKQAEPKSDWVSLWIAFIILLILGVQFSIYFSSMYPYLQQVCCF